MPSEPARGQGQVRTSQKNQKVFEWLSVIDTPGHWMTCPQTLLQLFSSRNSPETVNSLPFSPEASNTTLKATHTIANYRPPKRTFSRRGLAASCYNSPTSHWEATQNRAWTKKTLPLILQAMLLTRFCPICIWGAEKLLLVFTHLKESRITRILNVTSSEPNNFESPRRLQV